MITRYTKNVATTMQRIWYYGGSVPYILDSSFRIGAVHLFICLSVSAANKEYDFLKK